MTVYYPTISPAEFEKALTRACLRAVTRAERYEPLRGGDQTAVQYGPLIGEIADEADLSVPQTRRRLQALQLAGKVIRDDRRGGSTAWWLVGLAETQRLSAPPAANPVAPPARQAFTAPVPTRQHWADVLGVARDDSFRECTAAYRRQLNDVLGDTDANPAESDAALQRIKAAYDAAAKDHDVQVTE